MQQTLQLLHEIVWGPWTMFLFLGTGLFFTVKSGGFQIRKLPYWWKWFDFFIPDLLHCAGCYHWHRQYCRRSHGSDCRRPRCRVLALDFSPHRHGHGLRGNQPGTEVPLSQAGWHVAVRSHGVYGARPGLPEPGTDLCAVCGTGVSGDGKHGAGECGQ